jgi:hypothetical protein
LTVGGVDGVITALRDDDDDEMERTTGCEGYECGESDDGGPMKREDILNESLERLNRPPEPRVGDVAGSELE